MGGIGHNGIAADRLRSYIERIERLLAERAAIAADIKEVKLEAKSDGFDVATINTIIKLRAMEDREREEMEALVDIYKAALGMLDGTPLGNAAIARLSKKPAPPAPDEPNPDRSGEAGAQAQEEAEQKEPPEPEKPTGPTAEDIEAARDEGSQAASEGKPVTANPFPAGDPRRAAFDEAWCQATGSDGMDIPAAFRRTPKPKKPDGEAPEEARP